MKGKLFIFLNKSCPPFKVLLAGSFNIDLCFVRKEIKLLTAV